MEEEKKSVKQEQIHDLLFSKELSWQEIIYDLINTEQLDPWDINITTLTDKYLEKISELEEADYFVSSKVLLAAALLLRIKSEILLNKYIRSIDDILFGKKEEKKHILERIELDEDIPDLIPRSPIPRLRKVTLKELMDSLNNAITTENRRIKRELLDKNALREAEVILPRANYSIKNKIKEIYGKLILQFNKGKDKRRIDYTTFVGGDKEEKIISFSPLLHLEHQKKVWLEQNNHFEEIYIWLKEIYLKHNPDPFADLRQELEEELESEKLNEQLDKETVEEIKPKKTKLDKEQKERVKKINKDFKNPIGDMFSEEK